MKKALFLPLMILGFALAIPNTACSPKYNDLMDTLASRPDLGIMHSLIEAVGGPKTFLGKTKNFTMFAPTNEAASKVQASLQQAATNPEHITELRNLLKSGTIEGKLTAAQLANASSPIRAVGGNTLDLSGTANSLVVNGANVIESIDLGNSIIHVTDKVY